MAGCLGEQGQPESNSFRASVDRALVHRQAVSEVFLTGVRPSGNMTYTLWAQWPRWHVFYGSWNGRFDSAIVVETLRQLTVLVAHTQLDVPLDRHFLMPEMSVSMTGGARPDPARPADVTVKASVSELRTGGQGLAALRVAAVFQANGQKIAEGTARARIVAPDAYNRLRSRRRTSNGHRNISPVAPEKVGHTSAWNVVLGESDAPACWPLHVDVSNPILFDHPLDHVPGVLLIEAVRQALRLALPDPALDLATFEASFISMAELDDEATVVLESLSLGPASAAAAVSVKANGTVLMRTVAGFRPGQPTFQPRSALPGPEGPRGTPRA
ncbi:MAG TPA: ScbA/BarX family gamma-butyrolactone biosynthesis protein [Arthrobacter sp.]|jgi:hypothetical protein